MLSIDDKTEKKQRQVFEFIIQDEVTQVMLEELVLEK